MTSADNETLLNWFRAKGVKPADVETTEAILAYFNEYSQFPVSFATLNTCITELGNSLKFERIPARSKQMRSYEQISNEDGNIIMEWTRAANVEAMGDTILKMVNHIDKTMGGVINFANLNKAAQDASLGLVFAKAPTPKDYVESVLKPWFATLPEHLQQGFGPRMGAQVAQIMRDQYGNNYTTVNLNAALHIATFGTPPVVEQTPSAAADILANPDNYLGQGGRKQTGRVNHAHKHEAEPLTAFAAKAATMELLQGLQKAGHGGIVRELNSKAGEMLREGKSAQEVLGVVRESVTDYTATVTISKMIENAGTGSLGQIAQTRERFANAVKAGLRDGMRPAAIAALLQKEIDGERTSFIGNGSND